MREENKNEYLYMDEDMRLGLELKLIHCQVSRRCRPHPCTASGPPSYATRQDSMEMAKLATYSGGKIMEQKKEEMQPQTRAYTVEEIATILHVGRSSAYTLVKKGYFKSVRIGTAIRISRKSFDEWLDQL